MHYPLLHHHGAWSETDYLALGETLDKVELLDGALLVTPRGELLHQFIVGNVISALDAGATAAGVELLPSINVRLGRNRICIPDLVIAADLDMRGLVAPAQSILLAGEIATPHTGTIDAVLRRHLYSAAGIRWYLLVEQETGTLRLYRLAGNRYVEDSVTPPGGRLVLTEPVHAVLEPGALLPEG